MIQQLLQNPQCTVQQKPKAMIHSQKSVGLPPNFRRDGLLHCTRTTSYIRAVRNNALAASGNLVESRQLKRSLNIGFGISLYQADFEHSHDIKQKVRVVFHLRKLTTKSEYRTSVRVFKSSTYWNKSDINATCKDSKSLKH